LLFSDFGYIDFGGLNVQGVSGSGWPGVSAQFPVVAGVYQVDKPMNVAGQLEMNHIVCHNVSGVGNGGATFQGPVVCSVLDTDAFLFKQSQVWTEEYVDGVRKLVLYAPQWPIFKMLEVEADTVTTDKMQPVDDGDSTLLM
jgi:hypothetical protein